MTSLPPEWVDKYEDIQILIRDVDEISTFLLTKKSRSLYCMLKG